MSCSATWVLRQCHQATKHSMYMYSVRHWHDLRDTQMMRIMFELSHSMTVRKLEVKPDNFYTRYDKTASRWAHRIYILLKHHQGTFNAATNLSSLHGLVQKYPAVFGTLHQPILPLNTSAFSESLEVKKPEANILPPEDETLLQKNGTRKLSVWITLEMI